jgi:hypothetical protein
LLEGEADRFSRSTRDFQLSSTTIFGSDSEALIEAGLSSTLKNREWLGDLKVSRQADGTAVRIRIQSLNPSNYVGRLLG